MFEGDLGDARLVEFAQDFAGDQSTGDSQSPSEVMQEEPTVLLVPQRI